MLEAPGLSAGRGASAASVQALIGRLSDRLGLDGEDLRSLQLVRDYTSGSTGLRHLVFTQSFDGIPVLDATLSIHIDSSGEIRRITSSAARGNGRVSNRLITPSQAAASAAANVRPGAPFSPAQLDGPSGPRGRSRFARGPFQRDLTAELSWFPMDGGLRLAWAIEVEPDGIRQLYDVHVDAETGEVLLRRNRVRYSNGTGRVIQSNETAARDPRQPDQMPDSASSCPPPFNYELRSLTAPFRDSGTVLANTGRLEGNNTKVLRGNTATPSASGTFDGTQWTFDFPFNSAGSAEATLFFALNFAHDFFYDLGFDEAAGNFQLDNFGRGGAAGDPILGIARASGRNNATFLPQPEGTSPEISMFLWDGSGCWAEHVEGNGTPDVDGDFDLDIVLHEFHHGVSHRLNTSFTGAEADAIGEGGSDFFAYSVNGNTDLGEFAYPGGIRRVNGKTYADWFCLFGLFCEPHANGEIFANVLWDVRERFRTDNVRGSAQAAINESHQLYIDGLKLSPPAPTMLDIRDAMLQADSLRNPGSPVSENFCRVWESFATRGMGQNATDTADNGLNQVGADFTVPAGCNAPPAPPTITVGVTTATANEAGPVSGVFTINRDPAETSSAVVVNYVFNGTAQNGNDFVNVPLSATIPAGVSSIQVVITPIDDPIVEPNESVQLAVVPGPGYAVGAPSTGIVTIVSDDTAPDLVVSALDAPVAGGPGQVIQISDTTKNQGAAPAPESVTNLYVSTNSALDTGDTLIGTRSVGPLAPGAVSSATSSFTLPESAQTGQVYIIAKADGPGAVTESQENNNTRFDSIRIGPDLVVSALSAPSTAGAGGVISVTETTQNAGGGPASASITRFYLSENWALDAADKPLQTRSVPALSAGASSPGTTLVTIPSDTETGNHYLIAAADAPGDVAEATETNNTRSVVVRVGPDLQVTALSAPSRAATGTAIAVTETTKNAGAGAAEASVTAFYLSTNGSLEAGDVRLSPARAVGPLAAGSSSAATSNVVIPDVTPGVWYLIARADDEGTVAEIGETNNVRLVSIHIGPDLDVTALTAPSAVVAGSTFSVTDTVKNVGVGTAAPSSTKFYLSLNTTPDGGDIPVQGERAVPALAANATNTGSTMLTLPAGVTGSYYLIAVADGGNVVAEANETNNAWARLITINP